MKSLQYSLKITDPELTDYGSENVSISYNRKLMIERVLKSTDGILSLDLTSVGTIGALRILTSQPIILNPGGVFPITVNSDFLAIPGISVTSIQRIGTIDADVTILAYGVV